MLSTVQEAEDCFKIATIFKTTTRVMTRSQTVRKFVSNFLRPSETTFKMDKIFEIYSAKVNNDKVTEWDSNLLLPD